MSQVPGCYCECACSDDGCQDLRQRTERSKRRRDRAAQGVRRQRKNLKGSQRADATRQGTRQCAVLEV